jgi:hypothetical protein
MTTCDFRFSIYIPSIFLLKHFREIFYAEPCSKSADVSEKIISSRHLRELKIWVLKAFRYCRFLVVTVSKISIHKNFNLRRSMA